MVMLAALSFDTMRVGLRVDEMDDVRWMGDGGEESSVLRREDDAPVRVEFER